MNDPNTNKDKVVNKEIYKQINFQTISPVILFTFFTQILTILLTHVYNLGKVSVPAYEPFGNSIPGSVGNSLMMLVTVFFVTFGLVFLVRKKMYNFIKRFLSVFVVFASILIANILTQILLPSIISSNNIFEISIIISLFIGTIIGISITKSKYKFLGIISALILSVEMSSYFAIFIRPPTVFILPIIFGLYDIYAVFVGPLKTLIVDDQVTLGPLVVRLGILQIGLGDIVFYSFLPSVGLILFGVNAAIATILTTNIGLIITLLMLKKRKSFPGLPIPVLMAVIGLLLFYYV